MKKIRKNILLAITLVIAGLMIASAAVVGIPVNKENEKNIVGIPISGIPMTNAGPMPLQKMPITSYPTRSIPRGVDTLIFSSDLTNQNPAIVTDGSGNILVMTEETDDMTTTNLWGRWSTDGGTNWVDESEIVGWDTFNALVTLPELDWYGVVEGRKTAWGTIAPGPTEDGTVRYIGLPDITDPTITDPNNPDGWSAWYVDWATSQVAASYIDSMDVACYSNQTHVPSPEFWGLIALTGDEAYPGYEEDDTMMFSFFTTGGQVQIIFFYNMDEDVFNMKTDIDQSNGRFYMVMDYENNAVYDDGSIVYDTVITTDENWWQTGWSGFYFEGVFNPDVVASDENCYIVGEVDNGGQRDIVCLYSSDDGANFNEANVSADPANELYPRVTLVETEEGQVIVCSYIRDGNLYISTSTDGITWEEQETPLNDEAGTVVEQYNTASIDGRYASWTDERNLPTEIYFDTFFKVNAPPGAPTITGQLKGKIKVEYEYTFNAVDPDGDDVYYYVDWGDGTNTGWVGTSPSGQDYKIKHTWNKKNTYIITAKAKDVNGFIGPESTLEVSMPRIISINNLFLRFLERFPHAFPILRHLLGV